MIFFRRTAKPIRSIKKQETHFRWQIFRGILRLSGTALLLLLIWYITRLSFFTITEVAITGGETIKYEELQTLIDTELTGTYFLIVPKRFSYLYPKDRIISVIESLPRIHNVQITREGRQKIHVTFDEHVPYALVCRSITTPCWFITDTGYAFAGAPHLQGGTFTRHIIPSPNALEEGQAIDTERLTSLEAFVLRGETELGLRITTLMYREDGDIELLINGGGSILISGSKDLDTTFENLSVVLRSEEFKHLEPGNFQYVDVRFDNKVFVKEEITPIDVGTSTGPVVLPE